jgi:hypothetical protein
MLYIELLPEQLKTIFEFTTGEKIEAIEYHFDQVNISDPVSLKKVKLIIEKSSIIEKNNEREK